MSPNANAQSQTLDLRECSTETKLSRRHLLASAALTSASLVVAGCEPEPQSAGALLDGAVSVETTRGRLNAGFKSLKLDIREPGTYAVKTVPVGHHTVHSDRIHTWKLRFAVASPVTLEGLNPATDSYLLLVIAKTESNGGIRMDTLFLR